MDDIIKALIGILGMWLVGMLGFASLVAVIVMWARAKSIRIFLGHTYFYGNRKDWFLAILCKLGLHKTRIRKFGKAYQEVCIRQCCEYTRKVAK